MTFDRSKSTADKANTVDAKNQLDVSDYISFINKDGCGIRIMFAGNSITRHGVKEDIGWLNDFGMAASSIDNDYVHILAKRVLEKKENASFCIAQCAAWERAFWDDGIYDKFEVAKNFAPDILIFRLGENVQAGDFEKYDFKEGMRNLIKYLTLKNPDAKIIFTTNFWIKESVDNAIIEVAKEYGKEAHDLGLLGENPEMKAIGLFAHSGVAAHPGDKGMKAIADVIWSELRDLI